jgi:hypothetical protein
MWPYWQNPVSNSSSIRSMTQRRVVGFSGWLAQSITAELMDETFAGSAFKLPLMSQSSRYG